MGQFETSIQRLWSALRLGEPRIDDGPSTSLSVDGHSILLAESADGRSMLITGRVGRLATDPVERERQTRRLLTLSLGLMQGNASAVTLDRADVEAATVVVQALHPYDAPRPETLTERIEQVLQAVEILRPELETTPDRRPAATRQAAEQSLGYDSIIFRP